MQNQKTTILVEGAAMVALAAVLSCIRIIRLPWGGSVTLLSMLPIILFSIRRGVRYGLLVSLAYSLFQLGQSVADGLFGWGLSPAILLACIFLDYIGAFTVLGLAGIFRKKTFSAEICGIALSIFARFFCHFLSGVIVWHSFGSLWKGFSTDNTFLYSFLYNGCYMLPELILTAAGAAALLRAPQSRRILFPGED